LKADAITMHAHFPCNQTALTTEIAQYYLLSLPVRKKATENLTTINNNRTGNWPVIRVLYKWDNETYKYLKQIIVYAGNKAKLDFNLKDYSTKEEVLAAVDRIRYLGENTNTTGGLKVARLEVFGSGYDRRSNVDKIIVLITDGVPT